MKLSLKTREHLFNKAKSLGLDGSLFQNDMKINSSLLSDEITKVLNTKKEQIDKYDHYALSLCKLISETEKGEIKNEW